MTHSSTTSEVGASTLAPAYQRNRQRSRAIFDLISEDAYYSQPIDLRHPIVFYEGHLPAFSFNTLVKRALGRPSIDLRLEQLFARGIDPSEAQHERRDARSVWPSRPVVQAFAAEADRQILDALTREELHRPGHALLDRGEAVFTILEHEAMHQETLLYMWHRLPHGHKRRPADYRLHVHGEARPAEWVDVEAGTAALGVDRGSIPFAWDNECPAHSVSVGAFSIERQDVTNGRYLEFVEAGGYANQHWWRPDDWAWIRRAGIGHPAFWEKRDEHWHWRGMFEWIPLPLSWPVYVSHAEASAFARWRGARLPTEAEFQHAAFGGHGDTGARLHPWGNAEPTAVHGVFDFSTWDPRPAGSHPAGRSLFGVDDLVGNGWEWTSSRFAPFPGFRAMASYPEYSADFFDGQHYVMKGASPATARELLRPSFRNWFRSQYPYVYATFRLAQDRH